MRLIRRMRTTRPRAIKSEINTAMKSQKNQVSMAIDAGKNGLFLSSPNSAFWPVQD